MKNMKLAPIEKISFGAFRKQMNPLLEDYENYGKPNYTPNVTYINANGEEEAVTKEELSFLIQLTKYMYEKQDSLLEVIIED